MPIIKSAKKALRQSYKRRAVNSKKKKNIKDALKKLKLAAREKNKDDAEKFLSLAYKAYDKAAKTGVIKPNNASRHKSRLANVFLNRAKFIK